MAFQLHASNPRVKGNDAEHLRQWCAAQEVRTMLGEQNPAVADALLPFAPSLPAINGLPLVPNGVRFVVDESAPNTVDVSVEISGVTFNVSAPGVAPFSPTAVPAVNRTSTSFPARVDELYSVQLVAGGSVITTVLVPVNRAVLRALREYNRQGAYQFVTRTPDPNPNFVSLLALWSAANDAAATNNAPLYYDLIDLAMQLIAAAPYTPIAVYPYPHA